MRTPLLAAVMLLGFAMTACIHPTPPRRDDLIAWESPPTHLHPPRRVVFLPLDTEVGHESYARQLQAMVRSAMVGEAPFEIVPVSQEDLRDVNFRLTRERGVYRSEDLIRLAGRFGTDGVLFGVLTHFRAAPSVSVGLRMTLLDCRTGEVSWASSFVLDAEDARVDQDVRNFVEISQRATPSLMGHERVLISPRLFGIYTASRLADTLRTAYMPMSTPMMGRKRD
ncbi:MAG TPA: hypothetical protein ENK43_05540 [Planctomycetes bacterium]|nr:hypothetical protein [Planctomycetota bacterium]